MMSKTDRILWIIGFAFLISFLIWRLTAAIPGMGNYTLTEDIFLIAIPIVAIPGLSYELYRVITGKELI